MSLEIQSVAKSGERINDAGRYNFVGFRGELLRPGAAEGVAIFVHCMRLLRDAGSIHQRLHAFVNSLRGVRDAVLSSSRGDEQGQQGRKFHGLDYSKAPGPGP